MPQLHHKFKRHASERGKSAGVASYFAQKDKGKPLFPLSRPQKSELRRERDAALAAPAPGVAGCLGKTTKSDYKGPSAGTLDAAKRQASRYDLQDVARRLLPGQRVANCMRARVSKGDGAGGFSGVQVLRSESGGCHFGGLQVCGSVWTCPVCAIKISEHRRVELVDGVTSWRSSGGVVSLLTLTAPHWEGSDLVQLLAAQALALKRFWADRHVVRVFRSLGVVGRVRAMEVTHGANGWHPHYHILIFAAASGRLEDVALLSERWAHCCVLGDLGRPSLAHGLRLHDGTYAAAYATKWGIEHELTKGHLKHSRGGKSPFDLLRSSQVGDLDAGRLYQVYASAFKGRRQLFWTRGLRSLLGLGVELDDQAAAELAAPAELVGSLTLDQWRYFVRLGLRGALLAEAAISWDSVIERWRWPFMSRPGESVDW